MTVFLVAGSHRWPQTAFTWYAHFLIRKGKRCHMTSIYKHAFVVSRNCTVHNGYRLTSVNGNCSDKLERNGKGDSMQHAGRGLLVANELTAYLQRRLHHRLNTTPTRIREAQWLSPSSTNGQIQHCFLSLPIQAPPPATAHWSNRVSNKGSLGKQGEGGMWLVKWVSQVEGEQEVTARKPQSNETSFNFIAWHVNIRGCLESTFIKKYCSIWRIQNLKYI